MAEDRTLVTRMGTKADVTTLDLLRDLVDLKEVGFKILRVQIGISVIISRDLFDVLVDGLKSTTIITSRTATTRCAWTASSGSAEATSRLVTTARVVLLIDFKGGRGQVGRQSSSETVARELVVILGIGPVTLELSEEESRVIAQVQECLDIGPTGRIIVGATEYILEFRVVPVEEFICTESEDILSRTLLREQMFTFKGWMGRSKESNKGSISIRILGNGGVVTVLSTNDLVLGKDCVKGIGPTTEIHFAPRGKCSSFSGTEGDHGLN
jgi:hypothetical protein